MNHLLRKIRLESGGILLLSVMVFFSEPQVLAALLGNIVVHEFGHVWMLRRRGIYIRRITFGITGLCIVCNSGCIPNRLHFLCAAAGPICGLLFSLACSVLGNVYDCEFLLLSAGIGVILSIVNLLPVKPLDGGRMLEAIAPRLVKPLGGICGVFTLAVGLYVMLCGYGTALAILGIFLLLQDGNL